MADVPAAAKLNCKCFLREDTGRISDYYRKIGDLGEGAFGDVWLARQRMHPGTPQEHEGRKVAVKRVRKPNPLAGLDEEGADSEEALEDFRTEVELMKALDHPSICRLLQVYEDPKNLYLVMEHIQGGELFDRIVQRGSFSEADAAQVMQQVASALVYCHQHGVVHRDIKPENIMVVDTEEGEESACEDLTVKVIDFGFGCRILEGVQLKAKVGTFLYSAPEVLRGGACDEKQDLWALGCVLFVLLSGNAPFFGANSRSKILEGSFSFEDPVWVGVSEEAKELIRGLLVVDPAKRLTAAQVHQHFWLQPCLQEAHSSKRLSGTFNHLDKLEHFHQQSLLRHVCAGALARQLDETVLHKLHCNFCALDEDGDGIISMAEFQRACCEMSAEGAGEALSERDLIEAFRDVDMDGSGHIDYTEFIAACIDRKIEDQESACWAAFQVFDLDGSGAVSYEELRQVVGSASMQATFSQDTLMQLWKQLMGDEEIRSDKPCKEGNIDFDHFLAALRGIRGPLTSSSSGLGEEAAANDATMEAKKPKVAPAFGLPTARRQHAAVASMGLPIASRRGADEPGLPIASRGGAPTAAAGGGLGLPIASRH
mmetsp:Transcript_83599/g.258511  ORF Transcript_83599/g.258511 Transcript_83599/m.258511 type:complete len:598 (-) Transcript_83599:107-1900(-)